jgi:hypothetical protein
MTVTYYFKTIWKFSLVVEFKVLFRNLRSGVKDTFIFTSVKKNLLSAGINVRNISTANDTRSSVIYRNLEKYLYLN